MGRTGEELAGSGKSAGEAWRPLVAAGWPYVIPSNIS